MSNSTQTLNSIKKVFANKFVGNGIKLGLGLLAIYIIIKKVDWNNVYAFLSESNIGFLFIGLLLFAVSKYISSLRINQYYKVLGIEIKNSLNFKITLLSMFYNLFLPFVGGEGYRVYYVKSNYPDKVNTQKLVWTALLDKVSGMILLVVLAIIFLQFSTIEVPYKRFFLVLIPIIFLSYYFIHSKFFSSFHKAWTTVVLYSLIIQILQIAISFLIMKSLGMNNQINDYLFIFLVSTMAYVLPFIGAREMAFVYGAEQLGLDKDLSATISILFYLNIIIVSLSGMYFLFFSKAVRKEPYLKE